MGTDRNRETILRFFDALSRHDWDAVADCLADDFVFYPGPDERETVRGREAFVESDRELVEGLPDLTVEVLDVVAEGDVVASRLRVSGTHQGEFMGIPASGNHVELEIANFSRCDEHGKIVEDRDFVDSLALMQQLGVDPETFGG